MDPDHHQAHSRPPLPPTPPLRQHGAHRRTAPPRHAPITARGPTRRVSTTPATYTGDRLVRPPRSTGYQVNPPTEHLKPVLPQQIQPGWPTRVPTPDHLPLGEPDGMDPSPRAQQIGPYRDAADFPGVTARDVLAPAQVGSAQCRVRWRTASCVEAPAYGGWRQPSLHRPFLCSTRPAVQPLRDSSVAARRARGSGTHGAVTGEPVDVPTTP
jgi:hypothetical protein